MKVAVLGSSGAMGSFFVSYFLNKGHHVTGSDIRLSNRDSEGFSQAPSNVAAVRGADLILVAVPMQRTTGVVRGVSRLLKAGTTLVEISSVKGKTLVELRKIAKSRKFSLLSVHPMFGPSSRTKKPKLLVIGGRHDLSAASHIFPDMDLTLLGAAEHDRLMAYTLSLVHLSNIAFLTTIKKKVGVARFEETASPTSLTQLDVAKAILSQDPMLYSQISIRNRSAAQALSSFIAELEGLKKTLERHDLRGFERKFDGLARTFDPLEAEASLRKVYSSFGA